MYIIKGTLKEMCNTIQEKEIVCWGIGNYFAAFLDSAELYLKKLNLSYLVDNDKQRILAGAVINNRKISVVSAEEFVKKWKDEILIITTVHYNAIIEQLKNIEGLESLKCFIYPLITHPRCERKMIIKRKDVPLIPSKIHYCWFGRGRMPEIEKQYVQGWKQKCPDYELICWNEENFDIRRVPYVRWAYEKGMWAFVSDYVRVWALYTMGGFYFDTDVEILKSIEELRYQSAFIGMEESGCVNSGVGMGAVRGNELLKELLSKYEILSYDELESRERLPVNAQRETELFRKYGMKANNQYQIVNDISVFPSEFFSPLLVGSKKAEITENTFSIHHYHLSWLKERERKAIWKENLREEDGI